MNLNRIAKSLAIATTTAACAGVVMVGGPAQAAPGPAPTTVWRLFNHEPQQGYHLLGADGHLFNVAPRADDLAACGGDQACRDNVNNYNAAFNAAWKAYNAEIWAAAEGLPTCDFATVSDDCLYPKGGEPFTVVRVNGDNYFVQDSTKPAAPSAKRHHQPSTKPVA